MVSRRLGLDMELMLLSVVAVAGETALRGCKKLHLDL